MKLSLKDFCEELSISIATGKNWLKLGKIIPSSTGGQIYFDRKYVKEFKSLLKNSNLALKKRRNKRFVCGTNCYKSYVSDVSKNTKVIESMLTQGYKMSSILVECLVAECAIQQFMCCNEVGVLEKYLNNEIDLGCYNKLIDDVVSNIDLAKKIISKNKVLFASKYYYEPTEDVLGLLYLSCKNVSCRKSNGAYYTPTKVVKKLVDNLFNNEVDLKNKRILDSSCGTGNFLLNLPDEFELKNIYANDIDEMSVKITRINLALKYRSENLEILYNNVTNTDFLKNYSKLDFDFIIGNPPWGSEFSKNEICKMREKYLSVVSESVESFDVFVEECLNKLKTGGILSFVLPQSILNVKAHRPIREIIQNNTSIRYLAYLGDVFDNVQCPSIILELEKTGKKMKCAGMRVDDSKREYVLKDNRSVSAELGFNFLTNDYEQKLLEKIINIPNKTTLKGQAKFALGIVTGNNAKYVFNKKTDKSELVIKGSNLEKYKVKRKDNYIEFSPENFQQVAPVEMYRVKEKLFYKFISKELVFAYDDNQTLSLNSCNILIPEIDGLSIKYIMAVLNSSVAQFFFKKEFNSMKVLRSHIEEIPIPVVSKDVQVVVEDFVNKIMSSSNIEEEKKVLELLDKEISALFNLTEEEYKLINYA